MSLNILNPKEGEAMHFHHKTCNSSLWSGLHKGQKSPCPAVPPFYRTERLHRDKALKA